MNPDHPDFLGDIFPRLIPSPEPSVDAESIHSGLDKDATHYRMDHGRRGVAAIFYQVSTGRDLVVNDVKILSTSFKSLGFDVETFKDLTVCELDCALQELSLRDHTDCDSIVVVYLGGGVEWKMLAKDKSFNVNCLWGCFTAEKSPTLANKPKLFFVHEYNELSKRKSRLNVNFGSDDIEKTQPTGEKSYYIPDRSDFLIVLSNVPGIVHSGSQKSSRYIHTLCQHLDVPGNEKDIMTILTEVNCRILNLVNDRSMPSCDSCKNQLPTIISLLIRIVRFSRKTKGSYCKNKLSSLGYSSEEDIEEDLDICTCSKRKRKRRISRNPRKN